MESDEESGSNRTKLWWAARKCHLSASLFSGTRSERSSDCPSLALR